MLEKANRVFRDSFYQATDATLPEPERRRQAAAAYRLHMTRISLKAAKARKAAAAARAIAEGAEAELQDLQRDDDAV
jgi:hypothetical protein